MTELASPDIQLRPEMDWNVAVPSMDETGSFLSFGYADEKVTKAEALSMERSALEDINLVMRQFLNLQIFYGMHDLILAWMEELIEAEMAPDQAVARASYAVAILLSGVNDLSFNLNEHLGRSPAEEKTLVVPLSPLHLFSIYFCAMATKEYFFPRAEEAGSLFFGSMEELKAAVERVLALHQKINDDFSGAAHPILNLVQKTFQEPIAP